MDLLTRILRLFVVVLIVHTRQKDKKGEQDFPPFLATAAFHVSKLLPATLKPDTGSTSILCCLPTNRQKNTL